MLIETAEGGTEGMWKLSVVSAQFCCEPKAALKKLSLLKKLQGNRFKSDHIDNSIKYKWSESLN